MIAEVSAEDIVAIIHDTKNVRLVMSYGKYIDNDISYYSALRMINGNFVRINKNTIVNLQYASRIEKGTLYLANDDSYEIDAEHLKDTTNVFYRLRLEKFRSD